MYGNRSLKLTGDGNAAESEAGFAVQHIFNEMRRREHDGVGDEAVLVTLHSANHRCLSIRTLVVMYNTNSTKKLNSLDIG